MYLGTTYTQAKSRFSVRRVPVKAGKSELQQENDTKVELEKYKARREDTLQMLWDLLTETRTFIQAEVDIGD